MVQQIGIVIN